MKSKVRAYAEGAVVISIGWWRGVPFKDSFLDKHAIVALTDDSTRFTPATKSLLEFRAIAKPCGALPQLASGGDNGVRC